MNEKSEAREKLVYAVGIILRVIVPIGTKGVCERIIDYLFGDEYREAVRAHLAEIDRRPWLKAEDFGENWEMEDWYWLRVNDDPATDQPVRVAPTNRKWIIEGGFAIDFYGPGARFQPAKPPEG